LDGLAIEPPKALRYTVVNNPTVLVDPRTHRIVQIIE
jgi:hypothetical protein